MDQLWGQSSLSFKAVDLAGTWPRTLESREGSGRVWGALPLLLLPYRVYVGNPQVFRGGGQRGQLQVRVCTLNT